MSGEKKARGVRWLLALRRYLLFFLLMAFVISCCMTLFLNMMSRTTGLTLTQVHIEQAAKVTFLNVLLLSLLCTVIDGIRRKIMVDRPVWKITSAAERIMKGDFSVRIPPIHIIDSADGFGTIAECLNKMAQELAGMETLRTDFIANVSHELKTPLTSILGTAEIMAGGLVKPADIPHFAGNIHREAQRLIGLVNDIIKLSRLDEGGPTGAWETVDLYGQARAISTQLQQAAEKKNVTMELRGGPAMVRGVPQIVEEILYNLWDNAIAYNRPGGSVTVTVTDTPQGARVTVSDTGIGIVPEARERVFERFYRVDKSHSAGGTGLGLSIVKHGAAYLGASVTLESEAGKGSTFTVTFPPVSGEDLPS